MVTIRKFVDQMICNQMICNQMTKCRHNQVMRRLVNWKINKLLSFFEMINYIVVTYFAKKKKGKQCTIFNTSM